jgi:hypothetical protein
MQNKYKVSERNGQPAIFTDRGLVCLMEAGNQSTREKDAAEIVAILNAAPDLLAAVRQLIDIIDEKVTNEGSTLSGPTNYGAAWYEKNATKWVCKARGIVAEAGAAIAKAEGIK